MSTKSRLEPHAPRHPLLPLRLATGKSMPAYSNAECLWLQRRQEVPTTQDVTAPSFKGAVKRTPAAPRKVTGKLLTAAGDGGENKSGRRKQGNAMLYHHQQTGKMYLLVLAPAVIFLWPAWLLRATPEALIFPLALFLLLVLIAFSFRHLTIRDEGDYLALRYGPIPLFWKRFPYAQMTAVEPSRSTVLDGWGIHYIPGRGWTYNLWGFDCVKVQMGRQTVRIGTDDVAGLAEFLRGKIAKARP